MPCEFPSLSVSSLAAFCAGSFSLRVSRRWMVIATALLLMVTSLASLAQADEPGTGNCIRPQDQFWLLSTRDIACVDENSVVCPHRMVNGAWEAHTVDSFLATVTPEVMTVIYLHGNRKDADGSVVDGLATYQELVGKYSDDRPVRFLVWTWPSDQIPRPLKDVRVKASRSDDEAWMLGKLLSQFPEGTPLGFVGFSMGCRITSGALHLLEGEEFCGRKLEHPKRFPTRVVFWAAALDSRWLLPDHCHSGAIHGIDRMLILINSCDSVLKYYHLLERDGAQALGFAGLSTVRGFAPEIAARVEQRKVEHLVGEEHDSEPYLYNSYIAQRARDYVLWYQVDASSAAAAPATEPTPAPTPPADAGASTKPARAATAPKLLGSIAK